MQDIKGYKFIQTCGACPEQYDVLKDGKQVGYLRLRHGYFTAEHPDCGDKMVYEAKTKGGGIFDSDEEREFHLNAAIDAIATEQARTRES